jgi:hypothetical protein
MLDCDWSSDVCSSDLVLPAKSLSLISAALAANPAFQLETDAPRR